MDIPFSRWYNAIEHRRSRRQFDLSRHVPEHILSSLRSVCTDFRPFPFARAELVTERCDEAFKGIAGSYGKIKCARAFVAFIGDMRNMNTQEAVGYTGEGIILEATSLRLDTCWVAGFFKPAVVTSLININDYEKVLAITPVGYATARESLEEKIMTGFGRSHTRRSLRTLVSGLRESEWPEWVNISLQSARLAPSAINRQPWGFHIAPEAITVAIRTTGPAFNVSKRLDCGIAMLHLQVAALHSGATGRWEFLESPDVARLTVVAR